MRRHPGDTEQEVNHAIKEPLNPQGISCGGWFCTLNLDFFNKVQMKDTYKTDLLGSI